jgi:hypothetical protein
MMEIYSGFPDPLPTAGRASHATDVRPRAWVVRPRVVLPRVVRPRVLAHGSEALPPHSTPPTPALSQMANPLSTPSIIAVVDDKDIPNDREDGRGLEA